MSLSVSGMDHIVLRVSDAEASTAWYQNKLGLEPVRLDEWRAGEAPFVSMRIDATTIIDLQEIDDQDPGRSDLFVNMDHVALVVDDSLDDIIASGEFEIIRGPNRLFGARGWGHGVYVRDPDGNVVEFRTYD
ncbi:MAG: catechol 2,3-dioxygenase-like lactoylglutathione lyase family enzyme [Acidimicrobiales bacterium]|jgi:catechol 2,3-dioxygenase-like lactoylglutathione lyase family enzyme